MFTAITVLKHNQCVILVDIPGSLEDAQSLRINNHACRIRSSPPLSQPYSSNEPKGRKLAQVLSALPPEQLKRQRCLEKSLVSALNACKARLGNHGIPWCLPRLMQNTIEEADLSEEIVNTSPSYSNGQVPVVLSPLVDGNRFGSMSDLVKCAVMNPSILQSMLEVDGHRYLIPANSAFVMSSIADGLCAFEMAAPTFDLILMDPPWSNRSVRRSAKYKTHEDQHQDPFIQTLPVVKNHLKTAEGVVAVWVTNKHALRVQVVDALRGLGLQVVAEWTWIKVTDQGEPVTDMHGVWRKPYETLLVFSRAPMVMLQHVIIAVPDVHSRKPALKQLFAEHLPESYSALEIFARSLTAGWWSFGDQVLTFQDVRQWDIS